MRKHFVKLISNDTSNKFPEKHLESPAFSIEVIDLDKIFPYVLTNALEQKFLTEHLGLAVFLFC